MDNILKETKTRIKSLVWFKWEKRFNIKNNHLPGVYIIAKTKKELVDKNVNILDIYYVGMTNSKAGLIGRLNQFDSGIKRGYGHSGANRLFKEIKYKTPYGKWNDGEHLFVAAITFKCDVAKETRKPEDLLTMGKIASFEYKILAMIKKEIGKEPELNKK